MSSSQIFVSSKNSTTAPLAGSVEWVGESEDLSSFQEIDVNIFGAPANAPGIFTFEFSPDGINWDVSVSLSVTGPIMPPLPLRVILPRFRVKYSNGATPLTELRVTTVLHRGNAKNLTRFLSQPLSPDVPIEVVRAVIAGQKPDGSFVNLQLTSANQVMVAGPLTDTQLRASPPPVAVSNWPPELGGNDVVQKRFDIQTSVIFIGSAALGTTPDAAAWTIKKIDLDGNGNPIQARWTDTTAVWDDRLTESYS